MFGAIDESLLLRTTCAQHPLSQAHAPHKPQNSSLLSLLADEEGEAGAAPGCMHGRAQTKGERERERERGKERKREGKSERERERA